MSPLQAELVTGGPCVSALDDPGCPDGATAPTEESLPADLPTPLPSCEWVRVALTFAPLFINFCRLQSAPCSVAGAQIWASLLTLATCCAAEHLPAPVLCSENAGIVRPNYNLAVIIRLY